MKIQIIKSYIPIKISIMLACLAIYILISSGLGCDCGDKESPTGPTSSRTLNITITYSGTNKVDGFHPIYVTYDETYPFDDNYFKFQESLDTIHGTLTGHPEFSPCYVRVFHDKDSNGKLTQNSCESYEVYDDKKGAPATPIKIDKNETKTISITFGDNYTTCTN